MLKKTATLFIIALSFNSGIFAQNIEEAPNLRKPKIVRPDLDNGVRKLGESAELIFGEHFSDYYTGVIKLVNTAGNPQFVNPRFVFALQKENTSVSTDVVERMTILPNGSVGIGTSTTHGYMLAVNGGILSEEVRILPRNQWPDYVFEKEYELTPLLEVENFINKYGHLKDVPSATEVAENGVALGDMSAILLRKVEELTLYSIDQEKRIKKQDDEIKLLKEQLKLLAAKVNKMN